MLAKNLFEGSEGFNMPTLRFHVPDHIVEDVSWFSAINILDAFPIEDFNYFIKKCIRITSLRYGRALEEGANVINSSVKSEEQTKSTGWGIRQVKMF